MFFKKKAAELFGRSAMPYADFVKKVNGYSFEQKTDGELKELLHASQADEERYAILKEIIRRLTGLTLFDTQLAAAASMQKGRIAELPTGEGKTLSAVLTAVLFALGGQRVHVLVFNDYLAKRDAEANKAIYDFCGLTSGVITEQTPAGDRQEIYRRDVIYLSAKESGFDFLRNFLCNRKEDLLAPAYEAAIVDEADSILLDEARSPLVIAGDAKPADSLADHADRAVAALLAEEVGVKKDENQVWLEETGTAHVEQLLGIENLYGDENSDILTHVNTSLEAYYLLDKDIDYLVKDGAIAVVDKSTGRVATNRRFPDLLHRAVERKEQVAVSAQTMIFNSITMQAFLLSYETLCGMTGTAKSSEKEIENLYEKKVDAIGPHIPCIREDHEDEIFSSEEEKAEAVLAEIRRVHAKGQPILLGTQSVADSEKYSALLTEEGIDHFVLNARNDEKEAELIAHAGERGRVTVSTNMAGRGVDIRLGGPDEADKEFVAEAGGLYVIGTGVNESLRIDNQLRGRSGRQGDPGESKFFAATTDAFLTPYFEKMSEQKRQDYSPAVIRQIQKEEEGAHAENRYQLSHYGYIIEEQRKVVTAQRTAILKDYPHADLFEEEAPEEYHQLEERVGERGAARAEQQLLLYYLNQHWADYLSVMEEVRGGIHLMVVGRKSPVDEYHKTAIAAFGDMREDIRHDVLEGMRTCRITENGIDMDSEGLGGATNTWTYMINDSQTQFSAIPRLLKNLAEKFSK